MRRASFALLLVFGAMLGWLPDRVAAEERDGERARPRCLIVGHMGAPMEAPENTLESFEKALELGANGLETDLTMTKDGFIVLWHDWSPNGKVALLRQMGRQGLKYRPFAPNLWEKMRRPVIELTLAELRRHYGYTLRKPEGGKRVRAGRICTLQEFCAWAAGRDDLEKIFFDIKLPGDRLDLVSPYFSRILAVLQAHDLVQRTVLLIPDKKVAAAAVRAFGSSGLSFGSDQEIPTGLVINPKKFSAVNSAITLRTSWASIGRPVFTFLGYSIFKKIVTADLQRRRTHNARPPAVPIEGYLVWTIDKADEIRELIQIGVSGIVTNRPGVVKQVMDGLSKP